jgi:hypothetical protein
MSGSLLPLGTSDFDDILADNSQVIDKTEFIKEFMDHIAQVICIIRPRFLRFL